MGSTSETSGGAVKTWGDGDSDDEELQNSTAYKNAGRVALILAIDATPDMFKPWGEEEEIPFRTALKCCVALWRSRIVSNPRDLVGILLVGTKNEKNMHSYPNLYILQPLSTLKATMIEELNQMTLSDDFNGFHTNIGSCEDFSLKELFWLAKILYDDAKATSFAKKIIYFTCTDNPHYKDRPLRKESITKFKDLGPVDFSLVTFCDDFQPGHFYNNLIPDEGSVIYPKDLNSLLSIVRVKERAKRPMCRTTLKIAPGVFIGIGVYSLARSAVPPKQLFVNERTNEFVTKTINTYRADTGVSVLKSEEMKMAEFVGETISFEKEELKLLNSKKVETGLNVVGYIERAAFDEFVYFRHDGYFIYPDDSRVNGSKEIFSSLLRRCYALKKVAIVKMVLTRGRTAKLACLIPSLNDPKSNESNNGGLQDHIKNPSGFYVVQIPFADEMRAPEFTPGPPASDQMIELMEKVIKKSSNKKFDLHNVKNPALQHKYRQIERLALGDGEGFPEEEFLDYTESNDDVMHSRVGEICAEIDRIVGDAATTSTIADAPTKKPINVAMEVKNGRVDKLTNVVLSDFLQSVGLKTYGKRKADLVKMIYEHFGKGDN